MEKHNTYDTDYTLIFSSVMNSSGSVKFIDHYGDGEECIGINVEDKEFSYRIQKEFPSIIADLIDLATAIHATDRLTSQDLQQEQTRIHVTLPVRHPELLSTISFQNKLSKLLTRATGSRWLFNFSRRLDSGRTIEQQSLLSPADAYVDEVTLWSGGLDALAGLYTRLQTNEDVRFMLFGAGSNNNVYARQAEVFNAVKPSFPNRLNLCRVPVRFSNSKAHRKNKISRARGVVFTLLGSACAYLMGQQTLYLYENGIGAINLPYRKSAVGLDHTRAVHPQILLLVSDLVSELLKEEFRVQNPFLFWTKAEMCQALTEDGRIDLPPLTKSCDSPHRKNPSQCGYCSSCILRKQSLAASQMEDKTLYVVPHGKKPVEDTTLYLKHMLAQVYTLRDLLNVSNPHNLQWKSITRRFSELNYIVDQTAIAENLLPTDMQKKLLRLYQKYISEWEAVESKVWDGFLNQSSDRQTSHDQLVAVQ